MSWQEVISHSIKDAQLSVINDYSKKIKDDVLVDYSLKSSRVWFLYEGISVKCEICTILRKPDSVNILKLMSSIPKRCSLY